jgi:hypothetical protein
MTRILIVDSNGPGLPALGPGFAAVLQAISRKITCSLCAPYLGQGLPEGSFDGVVFTGSGVAWCVDAPEGRILQDIWRQVVRWKGADLGLLQWHAIGCFHAGWPMRRLASWR